MFRAQLDCNRDKVITELVPAIRNWERSARGKRKCPVEKRKQASLGPQIYEETRLSKIAKDKASIGVLMIPREQR